MRKTDYYSLPVLMLVPFLIYYSLFSTEYIYTDEVFQLWHYRKGSDLQMFLPQGRYITEKLFQWLFTSISTIKDVTYLRLFSFFGWMLSIPVWYFILKKIIKKENLPGELTFFSVLYMIVMPPFSMYVSWASCMELFLANTSALLSGYFLYSSVRNETINRNSIWYIGLSLCFGTISLFTYQTGFGCFLLPFVIHLVATKRITKLFWISIGFCMLTYILYFFLFKFSLYASGVEASNRTGIYIDPFRKLKFMLARPMVGSFHFTLLFTERSKLGFLIYALLAGGWFVVNFKIMRNPIIKKVLYFLGLLCLLLCIYIPGLIVKENYASNRTLFALNMAVFLLVFETVFHFVKSQKGRFITVTVMSVLFCVNAWYNFNVLFLSPVATEYKQVRTYLEGKYFPGMNTVHFVRPQEDFFVKRFGITRSWDEFGVPSTFFDWVPEPLVKQVIFEKTGNRDLADKIIVKHWLGREAYLQSGEKPAQGVITIDVEEIMFR